LFSVVKPAAHLAPFYGGPRDHVASNAWDGLILSLLRELPEEPRTLMLSDAVLAEAMRFHDDVGREMAPGGSFSSATLKPFASKLRGQQERLIGILHMGEHGPAGVDLPVSVATGEKAAELARYFLAHGRAAFTEALVDPADALAVRIWEKLRRDRLRTLKPRDLRALDASAEEIRAALAVLVDRHVVRAEHSTRKGETGRKPTTPLYVVNPKALEVAPYGT
jgi:hypothetical protein